MRFQVVFILQLLVADLTLKDPLGVGDHQVLPQKPLCSEFLITKLTSVRMRSGLHVVVKSFRRGVLVLALAAREHLLLPRLLVGQVAVRVQVQVTHVVKLRRTDVTSELAVLVLSRVLQELLQVLEHF